MASSQPVTTDSDGRVNLRATEEGNIFQLGLGGQIDASKVVEDRAELERVVRLGTGRTDFEIGKVRLIYVLRYVLASGKWTGDQGHRAGLLHVWSIRSVWAEYS